MATDAITSGLAGEMSRADAVEFENWTREARDIFMNLATSNDVLLETMISAQQKGTAYAQAVTMLMNMRRELTEAISNLLKAISEAMRSVIANLRP